MEVNEKNFIIQFTKKSLIQKSKLDLLSIGEYTMEKHNNAPKLLAPDKTSKIKEKESHPINERESLTKKL